MKKKPTPNNLLNENGLVQLIKVANSIQLTRCWVTCMMRLNYLNLDARNPVFGGCLQQRCRSPCASAHSDQRLCHLLIGKYHSSTSYRRHFNFIAGLCSWGALILVSLCRKLRRQVLSRRSLFVHVHVVLLFYCHCCRKCINNKNCAIFMRGFRWGGDRAPPPPRKSHSYRLPKQYSSRTPGKSQSYMYQDSFQSARPTKRHLNSV